jgi:protein subunit release factor A
MPEEGLSDRLFQALKDLNVGSGSAANRIKTYEYVQNAL